jgi:foldase protein PrsA
MTRPFRLVSLLAVPAIALVIAGCGNDVPSNGVAKVGDTVIKKSEFDHWLQAAAAAQQPAGGATKPKAPDAPNFTTCVATKKKQPVPEGQKKPTDADLKKQCKQEYDALKTQVMQFLISAQWIQQEAKDRKIKVSDAEVKKSFEDQKKQSFPKEADYKKFLASSGQTEADILYRVKLDLLSNQVRNNVVKDKGKVSDKEIQDYYNKNKQRFAQPERRDLNIVLTKKKADADKAKSELDGGKAFKAVAKKYSEDEASKSQGGKLPGVAKGQQEKALDEAVFKAKKGVISGPVKTQFGYYVFEVTKVTAASQQNLEQAKETIRNLLKSEKESKALDSFVKDFQKKRKSDTKCAKGYVTDQCDNAPKPKTDTGQASGGSPQPQTTPTPQQPGAPQGSPQGTPQPAPQGTPQPAPQGTTGG